MTVFVTDLVASIQMAPTFREQLLRVLGQGTENDSCHRPVQSNDKEGASRSIPSSTMTSSATAYCSLCSYNTTHCAVTALLKGT